MKYSIVIPTYNHCDDLLKPCIESIIEYTDLSDIELIVSANGCKDGTSQYLDELRYTFNALNLASNFKVAWSDAPSGYPKATNDGIKLATTDKIVLLNNDCVLQQQSKNDWLKLLDKPFANFKKCGISCVVKDYSPVIKMDFAIFFCVMVHKKLFDELGYLNEEYGMGSSEDIEFCLLAQQKGYEIHQVFETQLGKDFFVGNFPIYHKGEGTVHDRELVQGWEEHFQNNKLKLANKINTEWNKMNNDKKIGVITTVYNDVKHILKTVDSVKSQTLKNVVHYIYDDASTDGLNKTLQKLNNDLTIEIVYGAVNKGQSHGRNELIKMAIANGCDYIAFLDSDDVWTSPTHLQDSIKLLSDADIVYSKPSFVDENGDVSYPVNIPVPHIFIGKQLYHNNFIWISSVVCKKEVLLVNNFDGELNSIEDWDLWIRLFEEGWKFQPKDNTSVQYLVRNSTQASLGNLKMPIFNMKHKRLPQLKLHLACGDDYNDSYINVDLYAPEDQFCDVRFDVAKLPYDDNSVDEIKAFHIIEHFHFFEIKDVLNEWYRVLKPGGKLYLETPDFLESCRAFVNGGEDFRILLYGHFFAWPWLPGQIHKFLFTEQQLRANLDWAGFKKVERKPAASKYVLPETVNLFLNVEAFK